MIFTFISQNLRFFVIQKGIKYHKMPEVCVDDKPQPQINFRFVIISAVITNSTVYIYEQGNIIK